MPSLSSVCAALAPVVLAEGGDVQPPPPEGFLGKLLSSPLGLVLLIVPILYFLWFRPESKRQKSREAMLKGLKKGDQVVTTSGLIGRVHRADETEVVLQVDKDSNVRVRFLKNAVSELLTGGKESAKGASGDGGAGKDGKG